MKKYSFLIVCFFSFGLILAQQSHPSSDVPRMPEDEYNISIENDMYARQFEILGEIRMQGKIEPGRRYIQRHREYEPDTRSHSNSKLRENFVRLGKIPGFPGTGTEGHKKSGLAGLPSHKLDGSRHGSFDPYADTWVDYRIYGYVRNDTGTIVEGYTVDQIDGEGTIDTVYKYYYHFGEDGLPTERVTYQWDYSRLQLLPFERRLYEFYRPDSIINILYFWDVEGSKWVLTEKQLSYFEDELNTGSETYTWFSETEEWRLRRRSEVEFLDEGRHLITTSWRWDESTQAMIGNTRYERAYDLFGNEILYASSRWNVENSDFYTWIKVSNAYSDLNKKLESSVYFWLADSLGLLEMSHEEYGYVSDTLLDSWTRYEYVQDSSKMLPSQKIEYSYDDQDRIAYRIELRWDRNIQEWDISYKVEYEYDNQGLVLSETGYRWLDYELDWELSQKYENEYDPQDRLISVKVYNRQGSGWLKYQRTDYIYDNYGNLAQTVKWIPDEWTDEWIPDTRDWTVYNEYGSTNRRSYSHWEREAGAWTYFTESFKYTPEGYIDKMRYSDETADGSNRGEYLTEMLYNDEGMFSGWMEFDWDETTKDWARASRGECIYGEGGKIVSTRSANLDAELNKWINDYRVDASYDENNRVTSLKYIDWDNFEQEWHFWDVDSFVYDMQGRIVLLLYLERESETDLLVNWRKWEYTYDEAGNPETEKYMRWDKSEGAWINYEFYEYAFNENGQLIASKAYDYDEVSGSWETTFQEEFSYTASGNRSQLTRSEWDDAKELWNPYLRTLNFYDGLGNLISKETSTMSETKGDWEYDSREIFVYDSQIEASEVWLPFDVGYNTDEILELRFENDYFEYSYEAAEIEEMIYWDFNVFEYMEIFTRVNAPVGVSLQTWDNDKEEWNDWSSYSFYLSPFDEEVDVPELNSEEGFLIYPNPVSDLLNISLADKHLSGEGKLMIRIFDLAGRPLIHMDGGESQLLDVESLKGGVYIIQLQIDGEQYIRKFIKN